jgi:hypothetical protein
MIDNSYYITTSFIPGNTDSYYSVPNVPLVLHENVISFVWLKVTFNLNHSI